MASKNFVNDFCMDNVFGSVVVVDALETGEAACALVPK